MHAPAVKRVVASTFGAHREGGMALGTPAQWAEDCQPAADEDLVYRPYRFDTDQAGSLLGSYFSLRYSLVEEYPLFVQQVYNFVLSLGFPAELLLNNNSMIRISTRTS